MSTSLYYKFSTKQINQKQIQAVMSLLNREFHDIEYFCIIRIRPSIMMLAESSSLWNKYAYGLYSYNVNKGLQNNGAFNNFIKDCLEDDQFEGIDVKHSFATIIQIEVNNNVEYYSKKLSEFCRTYSPIYGY